MNKIIVTLLGAVFTSVFSIYDALCPILNQGIPITILVVWKQAKYQILGLVVISITLLLTLILKYYIQKFKNTYYY